MSSDAEYEDDYPTCMSTYATLRIFGDELDPEAVTAETGIQPRTAFKKGDAVDRAPQSRRNTGGWLLGTEGHVESNDTRRHVDRLLDRVERRRDFLAGLVADGCEIDIFVFWDSIGQGGPALSPNQMRRLASLGIEIGFDVYFGGRKELNVVETTLRLRHATLPASKVVAVLGAAQPTFVHSIGAQRPTRWRSTGEAIDSLYEETFVGYRLADDDEVEPCVAEALRLLEPNSSSVRDFVASGGRLALYVTVTADGHVGAVLDAACVARLAAHAVALELEFVTRLITVPDVTEQPGRRR